jgi:hypothetical protein
MVSPAADGPAGGRSDLQSLTPDKSCGGLFRRCILKPLALSAERASCVQKELQWIMTRTISRYALLLPTQTSTERIPSVSRPTLASASAFRC